MSSSSAANNSASSGANNSESEVLEPTSTAEESPPEPPSSKSIFSFSSRTKNGGTSQYRSESDGSDGPKQSRSDGSKIPRGKSSRSTVNSKSPNKGFFSKFGRKLKRSESGIMREYDARQEAREAMIIAEQNNPFTSMPNPIPANIGGNTSSASSASTSSPPKTTTNIGLVSAPNLIDRGSGPAALSGIAGHSASGIASGISSSISHPSHLSSHPSSHPHPKNTPKDIVDADAANKRKLALQKKAEQWKSRSIEVDIAVESNRRKRGDADDLTRKAFMLLDWMADMLKDDRIAKEKKDILEGRVTEEEDDDDDD